MKKLLFLTTLVLTSLTTFAQGNNDKLPDGIMSLEWRYNPFDYEGKPVNMAQFYGRLFLNNKSVVRLGVGVGFDRDKQEGSWNKNTSSVNANYYDIEHMDSIKESNELTLKLSVGYEYHFANTGRLDFYAGAEGGFLGKFCSGSYAKSVNNTNVTVLLGNKNTVNNADYTNIDYTKMTPDNKVNEMGMFATVFTGVDFFVYKGLYLGAELGITFNTGKKKNGNYTQETIKQTVVGADVTKHITSKYSTETGNTITTDHVNNTTTTTPSYAREHTGTYTKVYFEPVIRLGWMF
jgi:hypothetical protein